MNTGLFKIQICFVTTDFNEQLLPWISLNSFSGIGQLAARSFFAILVFTIMLANCCTAANIQESVGSLNETIGQDRDQGNEQADKKTHLVNLENDSEVDEMATGEMPEEADQELIRDRLLRIAIVAAGLLSELGLFFLYLKLEHKTRGFYSARLQAGAGILFLAILFTCYLLWQNLV